MSRVQPIQCGYGTCKHGCTTGARSHRANFLRAYPDGYPTRGSNIYRCQECGYKCTVAQMQVDHMKPKGRGGSNCVKNLQPLCGQNVPSKCNQRKGNTYSTSDKYARKMTPKVRRAWASAKAQWHDLADKFRRVL